MDPWHEMGRSFIEGRGLAPEALGAWVIPILVTIVAREISRGMAASVFGDKAPRREGRLSLNPLCHISVFGTLLLPTLLVLVKAPVILTWGKSSPVQFDRLKPRRLGIIGVALTGLMLHLLLASISVALTFLVPQKGWVDQNVENLLTLNISLFIFNILPILPLDGGRILWALLPQPLDKIYVSSEGWGLPILLLLVVILPLISFVLGAESFNLLKTIIGLPTEAITHMIKEWVIR